VSAAIFGLIGVIVGAAVSGWVSLTLERRRERQASRAALNVIDVGLLRAKGYIEAILEDGVWAAGTDTSVPAWPRYEDVLARQLPRDDFHFVALAVGAAERAPMFFAEQIAAGEIAIKLSEADRDGLTTIFRILLHGQIVLGKHLGPWPAETQLEPPPLLTEATSEDQASRT
jgi:hypothetical protein